MLRARKHRTRVIAAIGASVAVGIGSPQRSTWAKNYRRQYTHSPLLAYLREYYPEDFKKYLRMDSAQFDCLLAKVTPYIQKQDTLFRDSYSPKSRLAATLTYLTTGSSFEQLQFKTGMAPSTLRNVIPETCKAIFDVLKPEYLKVSVV